MSRKEIRIIRRKSRVLNKIAFAQEFAIFLPYPTELM